MPLPFLPALISYTDDNDLISQSLAVFREDFLTTPTLLNNKKVLINRSLNTQGWEESYAHVVTRGDPPRGFDRNRAAHVTWIRPLIENYLDPTVQYFQYLEDNGYVRDYIWDQQDDYLVILENKNGQLFLVTAFVIDVDWKRYDLAKKLKKASYRHP